MTYGTRFSISVVTMSLILALSFSVKRMRTLNVRECVQLIEHRRLDNMFSIHFGVTPSKYALVIDVKKSTVQTSGISLQIYAYVLLQMQLQITI